MKIRVQSRSAIAGFNDDVVEIGDHNAAIWWDSPIVKAFLEDPEITEISICSANIGFVKTLTKIRQETEV